MFFALSFVRARGAPLQKQDPTIRSTVLLGAPRVRESQGGGSEHELRLSSRAFSERTPACRLAAPALSASPASQTTSATHLSPLPTSSQAGARRRRKAPLSVGAMPLPERVERVEEAVELKDSEDSGAQGGTGGDGSSGSAHDDG